MTPEQLARFESKYAVEPNTGCWLWLGGAHERGYGRFYLGSRVIPAHRASYEHYVATIPDRFDIDHLCRTPACVNPDHLEPVTHAENMARGLTGEHHKRKTHCPSGHEYSAENTKMYQGRRYCRSCARRDNNRRNALKRGPTT